MSKVVPYRRIRRHRATGSGWRTGPDIPSIQPLAVLFVIVAIVCGTLAIRGDGGTSGQTANATRIAGGGNFGRCIFPRQRHCVLDGDTIRYAGMTIRLRGIDAPELFSPRCAAERALAIRARDRLIELLNEGPFEVSYLGGRDRDRYGRSLRQLMRNGTSMGDRLVDEGLAQPWRGRHANWCG